MSEKYKNTLLFFITCSIATLSIAQQLKQETPGKYGVGNWNTEQGFPSKYTTCILKDVNGFLWIGTKTGLSRWYEK
jgi:Two component regulator propeller